MSQEGKPPVPEILCLKFAKSCVKSKKFNEMFPRNKKEHNMETRNQEIYKVEHANMERYRKSAIIYMQNLLNEPELKSN